MSIIRQTRAALGPDAVTDSRRRRVMQWFLDGMVSSGRAVTLPELAAKEGVSESVISNDVRQVQRKIAASAGRAGTLQDKVMSVLSSVLDMCLQDRGRAIEQFDRLREECLDTATGGWKQGVAPEVSYQMVAFLRQAKEAAGNLARTAVAMLPRAGVNVNINNKEGGQVQLVTSEQVMKMLEDGGSKFMLPSVRYREKLQTLDMADE